MPKCPCSRPRCCCCCRRKDSTSSDSLDHSRGRGCGCSPKKCLAVRMSQEMLQLIVLLCVIGASFAVLFLVMNANDQYVCDYTDLLESCDEQPTYIEPLELRKELDSFDHMWKVKAQELRMETEEQKCNVETNAMKALTESHTKEARRIITECQGVFQKCVEDYQKSNEYAPRLGSTTTTTRGTTTTTTPDPFVKTTMPRAKSKCQAEAEAAPPSIAMDVFTACMTNDAADEKKIADEKARLAAMTTPPPPPDCTRCDSFCRAFDWTQQNPEYAATMNYTKWACGPKVCLWIPECGRGLNLHKNCSGIGCPCGRASCPTTTTTTATPARPAGGRRVTSTSEPQENRTCTCTPGYVDTVLVGRPFKVFYADPAVMHRRRVLPGTGRRLNEGKQRARRLEDIYSDPEHTPVEYGQGVDIEIEEELEEGDAKDISCKNYFSNRYKYVYPRHQGDVYSYQALLARRTHPDLGCGYRGNFKISCVPNPEEAGTCNMTVDISTCVPPNYQEAVDTCYQEDTWTDAASTVYVPEVMDFLAVEEINTSLIAGPASNYSIGELGSVNPNQCCEEHVGSECIIGQELPGTKNGTGVWSPEKSVIGNAGFFPIVYCRDQAPLVHRSCPRVKIDQLPNELHDAFPECDYTCNLTVARAQLQSVCDSSVFAETNDLEEKALRDKVKLMTKKRAQLESWSRRAWPKVKQTHHVQDCVEDMSSRRYNMVGWPGASGGFEKLKLRYMCRMNSCSINQCLKITKKCPIPVMSQAPELKCGPFGDENMYTCVNKVLASSSVTGQLSSPIGFAMVGLASCFFLCAFYACFQNWCLVKKARVVPLYLVQKELDAGTLCGTCGDLLESVTLLDSIPICPRCLKDKRSESCRNCGAAYDDPDDNFCAQCSAPREMLSLPTTLEAESGNKGVTHCKLCSEPLGENDGKCPECGWHVNMAQEAIVLRADTGPLRANAQSAANENRIVPVDADPTSMRPIVGQE